MKDRVRQITSRSRGRRMRTIIEELRKYLPGWKNYFQLGKVKSVFSDLDSWIRRRVRMVQLKQWKHGPKIYRELIARDVPARKAAAVAAHAGRWWAISILPGINIALPGHVLYRAGIPRLAT